MRLFVDTNILVDFVCRREPFASDAKRLFAHGYIGDFELQTSVLSFVNAMYIGQKYNHDEVRTYLQQVSTFVDVVDLKGKVVVEMLSSDWKDYEDATQNHTALLAGADYIITRNKKDFKNSTLPVCTIKEFFEIWEEKNRV